MYYDELKKKLIRLAEVYKKKNITDMQEFL